MVSSKIFAADWWMIWDAVKEQQIVMEFLDLVFLLLETKRGIGGGGVSCAKITFLALGAMPLNLDVRGLGSAIHYSASGSQMSSADG